MPEYYMWLKALHVIAIICWMAGLLYLPRLYVYHANVAVGSEMDKTFQVMERNLLRIIMNPSMIATYILGIYMRIINIHKTFELWFYGKMLLVLVLTIVHGMTAKWRKDFVKGQNKHSSTFYRFMNEVPSFAMVLIIIFIFIKPF